MKETPVGSDLFDSKTYQSPGLEADLIMKGGITSGIVFPHAICELAKSYRFRDLGGTSAGAIATAGAAAAEYGRQQGGFTHLAALPQWLGEMMPGGRASNMLGLFQPAPSTKSLFELILVAVDDGGWFGKLFKAAGLLIFRKGWSPWLAAAVAALASWWVIAWGQWSIPAAIFLALSVWLVLSIAGGLAAVVLQLFKRVPENLFGICSGNAQPSGKGAPALTPWLAEQIQTIAGRTKDDPPLTFEELERGGVNVRMMTTCITLGRPYLLPLETKFFYFHPDEFRTLFPEWVVEALVDQATRWSRGEVSGDKPTAADRLVNRYMYPRLPLPRRNLPLIVAVRMSLSFPVLLSAVPLWHIDWRREDNQNANSDWSRWTRDNETWNAIRNHPEAAAPEDAPKRRPEPERCWFSDGGICSNFPVHLFDSLLPKRPTFAINLKYGEEAKKRDDRVELATSNRSGILENWSRISETSGSPGGLFAFLGAMVDTMHNWTDNSMLRIPGFRDRIAHLHLADDEGGLNLKMSPDQIRQLTQWGGEAGARLRDRFTEKAGRQQVHWENHRWVRFRTALSLLQDQVHEVVDAYRMPPEPGARAYPQLVDRERDEPPKSYPWRNKTEAKVAGQSMQMLEDLAELWQKSEVDFREKAPRPKTELQIRGRMSG